MFRIAALAATAAAVVAAPAFAASIHIPTVGKSPAEVRAEVLEAATQLCRAENSESALRQQVQAACIRATVEAALPQANGPALGKIASR